MYRERFTTYECGDTIMQRAPNNQEDRSSSSKDVIHHHQMRL